MFNSYFYYYLYSIGAAAISILITLLSYKINSKHNIFLTAIYYLVTITIAASIVDMRGRLGLSKNSLLIAIAIYCLILTIFSFLYKYLGKKPF